MLSQFLLMTKSYQWDVAASTNHLHQTDDSSDTSSNEEAKISAVISDDVKNYDSLLNYNKSNNEPNSEKKQIRKIMEWKKKPMRKIMTWLKLPSFAWMSNFKHKEDVQIIDHHHSLLRHITKANLVHWVR